MTTIQVQLDSESIKRLENIEEMMNDINSKISKPIEEPDRLLKLDIVSEIVGFGRKWIYEEIQKGNFPSPIKIGTSSRWKLSVVKKWVESQ